MYNILYISYDGLTDPLGSSQILPYIETLSNQGHRFTIVSLEKTEQLSPERKRIKDRLKSKNIQWHALNYILKKGLAAKRKNNNELAKTVNAILQNNNIDLIHSRSYPASLIALKASQKNGIPFIFDMRGFWADERVDGRIWNLKKPIHKFLYRYFKKKEKLLLKKSTHIISLTQAAKDYMVKNFRDQVQENKITVIPCCADLGHFKITSLTDREQTRLKLDINPTQQVIIYSGSVGTWYLMDEMVSFFRIFIDKFPGAVFLVLTQKNHTMVHEIFQRNNIRKENYRITGASREEVPSYIGAADVGLYFIKPSFSKMASSPVKLAEFMGCGLPVVANAGIGDVNEHAAENNQVILVNELNETGYKTAIENLNGLKKDKNATRDFALKHYSLEMGIERYKKVYKDILSK
jgi:glycosyltransferase involved in cell wall biosynthesis